jgi:hypothetical protein
MKGPLYEKDPEEKIIISLQDIMRINLELTPER